LENPTPDFYPKVNMKDRPQKNPASCHVPLNVVETGDDRERTGNFSISLGIPMISPFAKGD
jgi:hypothetical protein